MKNAIIATASLIAIMATTPALADDVRLVQNNSDQSAGSFQIAGTEAEHKWEKAKQAVSGAAKEVANAANDTFKDIKVSMVDDNVPVKTVVINERNTAKGLIGRTIYNVKGEAVGSVHDVILDHNGEANMVVVADGAIFGLGKKVAFNYGLVSNRTADGDVLAPLTEEVIKQAIEFSYAPKSSSNAIRVIPANGYSVREMLDGKLLNPKNEKIGDINNIAFKNGMATQLIVGVNETLGVGGDEIAFPFNNASLVRDGSGYDFRLSPAKAAQFEAFRKSL